MGNSSKGKIETCFSPVALGDFTISFGLFHQIVVEKTAATFFSIS